MSAESKDEEVIFKKAIKLKTPAKRESYIKKVCGEDTKLLDRLKILLKAHEQSESFLESPPLAANVTLDDSPLTEGPGTIIGRYKLLEKIGEGGFGVVYMADQNKPISRRIALKIIKLGMDTKEVIARFEAERQALAMMEHPNIAKVLDAGATDTGRPYFVMELVKGIPITEYCDSNNLDTKQRLELFINVCKAIQHAHQKGIIHRDLKPSNVLITLHDGRPVPKVIDFGIAKATGQKLTEKTLFTRFAQMIGTPEYMSPEQAEFSGLDVDTRSDIYSLGVLLYQLLTGVTPFDGEKLREAGYVEMQRIIREDDPDKPSTKLSTMGEALTDIAKRRRAAPEALRKMIRGDLDWIVMKTLEKDRTRRYETASELAADIERHLGDELVLAGPPDVSYRLLKFLRRNRVAVITSSLVTIALLVAAVVSTIYAHKSSINANNAEAARLNAVKAQHQTAGLLAGSYVDHAQSLCEQGEVGRGMLWLADSLKIAPEDSSDLDKAVRTSLAAWQGQLHSLQAVFEYPQLQYPSFAVSFTEEPAGFYTMTSSGADIWGTADHFHFAYRILTGPGSITVRVDSVDNTHPWAKAGVMIRETLDADSANSMAYVTPSGRVGWQSRVATGGLSVSTSSDSDAISGPHWVRVERDPAGNFTALHSVNGTTWESVENSLPINIPMNTNVYVGLALSSHDAAKSCKAVFSNVRTTASVSVEWMHQVIGVPANVTTSLSARQVNSVTFSPDGSWILAACMDGTVRICDSTTGQPIGTPLHNSSGVTEVAMSPNGKRIAARSEDGLVQLWDAVTLESVGKPMQHKNKQTGACLMAFTPDGSRLRTEGTDGIVHFWDAETGNSLDEVIQYGKEVKRNVRALAYCPDGWRAVQKVGWAKYQMFDADRNKPVGPAVNTSQNWVNVTINPDGARFATGDGGGLIQVWDAVEGKLAMETIVHGGVVSALAFSPDGSRIVSGGWTRMALLWNATTGEPIGAPMRQRDTILALAFSPDGSRIVTGNRDGVVRIWDLIHDKNVGEPVRHDQKVLAAAYGPRGLRILTRNEDKIQVMDAATGEPVGKAFRHPADRFEQAVFSPDGSRLLTSSSKPTDNLRLWDLANGRLIGEPFHPGAMRVAFSPDGSRILSGGGGLDSGIACLWDAATLKCLGEFRQHRRLVNGVAFIPDGSKFLTGSFDGTTQLWDAAALEPIGEPLVHQSEVKAVAFSPDSSKLLIGFADGTVRLWDLATLKPIGTPLQYLRIVCAVAFSPDGSQFLACSLDRTARIWDTATLKPIGPPLEHNSWWPRASFSPDGSEILLADPYGVAETWRAPTRPLAGDCERIACWVQVVTGMELDSTGGINVLDASEWQKRRQRLHELGGPPKN